MTDRDTKATLPAPFASPLRDMSKTATKPKSDSLERVLNGPGMRIARWVQPNHSEEWDEARDKEVVKRAKSNAKQFPEFAKRLTEEIRSSSKK